MLEEREGPKWVDLTCDAPGEAVGSQPMNKNEALGMTKGVQEPQMVNEKGTKSIAEANTKCLQEEPKNAKVKRDLDLPQAERDKLQKQVQDLEKLLAEKTTQLEKHQAALSEDRAERQKLLVELTSARAEIVEAQIASTAQQLAHKEVQQQLDEAAKEIEAIKAERFKEQEHQEALKKVAGNSRCPQEAEMQTELEEKARTERLKQMVGTPKVGGSRDLHVEATRDRSLSPGSCIALWSKARR